MEQAACELIGKSGGAVVECLCVIELAELNGKSVLSAPFYGMIQY
jgi:adenine/guanine phosphoribosyltransferase-like PRPP-binding protein